MSKVCAFCPGSRKHHDPCPRILQWSSKESQKPAQVTRDLRRVRRRLAHSLDQEFGGFELEGYIVALRIEAAGVFEKDRRLSPVPGYLNAWMPRFTKVIVLRKDGDLLRRASRCRGRRCSARLRAGAELESRPPVSRGRGEAARRRIDA